VQRDDNVLEEDDMLISQRNSESTDDTGQNVKELGGTVEFVILVDERKETLVDGLTNHLSSWYELSVQLVKNVLQVVSLDRLLRVKQLEELLDELWSYIYFE